MDIFISGAACRAVYSQGAETYFVNLERPNEPIRFGNDQIPAAAISRVLGDSPDIRRISTATLEDGLKILLSDCNQDSSLRLFQLAVDFHADLKLATDAASVLEPLLREEHTYTFLRNYAFAIPADPEIDDSPPPEAFNTSPLCAALLIEVVASQQHIRAIRVAWERVSEDHFPTRQMALMAEKRFVDCGAFWHMTQAMLGNTTRDRIAIDLLMSGPDIYGSRQLIGSWIDAVHLERNPTDQHSVFDFELVSELDEAAYSHEIEHQDSFGNDSEKFLRVTAEKEAVVVRIQRNDLRNARRFTNELVSWQVQEGDTEFAAKTLCSLAQEAKRLGESSLQLEWSLQATEVYPDDPWSFAQAGDALVAQYRYAEAIKYFKLAGIKGDNWYAIMGRARILMLTRQSEEALELFEQVLELYPDHENVVQTWLGIAETLRHIGRLEESLEKYEQVTVKFPELDDAYSGKARLLQELGRLDEAAAVYRSFQEDRSPAIWAFLGAAEILKDCGEFDGAIKAYEVAAVQFQGAEAIVLGRGHVMRAAGMLDEALQEFEAAASVHEGSPRAYGGLAQTLRDLGRLEDALDVYEQAMERFPGVPFLLNGRASVLRRMRQLEEALRAYDENCHRFPYNLPALLGRVQLLKEFERLDLAFGAAEELAKRYPAELQSTNVMAGILALQGNFEEAARMLPTQEPRTRSEWVAHHIGCMIELRRGNIIEALTRLEWGVQSVPFYRNRRYYQNALAAAELRRGRHGQAMAAATAGDGAAADLLMAQAAAEMGNLEKAATSLNRVKDDPRENVIELAEEIGRRFRLVARSPRHDQLWIANRNTEIVLALAA